MSTNIFLQSMCLAIAAGLIGTAYRQVLAYKFPPVQKFFKWGSQFEKKWFYEPVWGCTPCISGQIALWSYLATHFTPVIYISFSFIHGLRYKPALLATQLPYSIIGHILAISGAIVLSVIFSHQYNKSENGGA